MREGGISRSCFPGGLSEHFREFQHAVLLDTPFQSDRVFCFAYFGSSSMVESRQVGIDRLGCREWIFSAVAQW
jgi:hypothetical protein